MSLACSKPAQPELPEVGSAVLAQMVKAQKDVKKYLALSDEYLACEKDKGQYNIMIDEMKLVGDNYNALVRDYKARS
jgi:hypothetical protein